MKLSTLTIDKLRPGPKRIEIGDDQCIGLKLLIQTSGKRSWAYRFRLHNKPMKMHLGRYPEVGLAAAREKANDARKQVDRGEDPSAPQRGPRAGATAPVVPETETVAAVLFQFTNEYVGKYLRPDSAKATVSALKRATAPWADRAIKTITKAEVREAIAKATERGESAGVKCRMTLSKFFGWAAEMDIIEHSPATKLGKMPKTKRRQRVLDDAELRRLWLALDKVEPWLAVYIKLLLLTAARRSEVSGLPWSEIRPLKDKDGKDDGLGWFLPDVRAKNHREHLMPLTATAVALLDTMPRFGKDAFVFTSDGGVSHRSNYAKLKQQLDAAIEADGEGPMQPWRLHDLRRTTSSGMAMIGVPEADIERALNHARSALVETYQVYKHLTEKRRAFMMWEQYLVTLIDGRPSNVVPIGKVVAA